MPSKELSLHEKIVEIQTGLKAPKNQHNKFGGYNYRSCEDILEALKPHLKQHGLAINISDEVVLCGGMVFVCATVSISDGKDKTVSQGLAMHEQSKKGMDGSQLTGATKDNLVTYINC